MTAPLRVETPRAGVALLTLDRPERRNALSIALLGAIVAELEALEAGGSVRVVILRGAGTVFSSGLDLAEAADESRAEESARHVAATLAALRRSPLVSIAAVHGGAFAGGAGLMAACDLAVGASDARIGFPEARRGLVPALVCDVLRAKVRAGDLAEVFLVGEPIDAVRAREIGLLQRVVPAEEVLGTALALADGILAGGPRTIERTKRLLQTAYEPRSGEHAESLASHLDARRAAEAIEGMRAFREKRKPVWEP